MYYSMFLIFWEVLCRVEKLVVEMNIYPSYILLDWGKLCKGNREMKRIVKVTHSYKLLEQNSQGNLWHGIKAESPRLEWNQVCENYEPAPGRTALRKSTV